MMLATEIVDWRRFEHPKQLACYLGLVSREDSSGDRQRLGSITKAGNSHCRHVLVQAAWSYHHRPQISVDLKRRQAGQPPSVIGHAWKAQQRCISGSITCRIGSSRIDRALVATATVNCLPRMRFLSQRYTAAHELF
jgi:hypothetical protein